MSIIRATLRAGAPPASPMPWIRSPSPMLSPMGVRGSSDAYGSWKMICIRRRYGLRRAPLSFGMSTPSNMIVPDVGSMSRSSSRPTVVLPQPDSPTSPSVSPRRISNDDAVDGLHLTDGPLQDAAPHREVLHEVADLDERYDARRRRRAADEPAPTGPGFRHAIDREGAHDGDSIRGTGSVSRRTSMRSTRSAAAALPSSRSPPFASW